LIGHTKRPHRGGGHWRNRRAMRHCAGMRHLAAYLPLVALPGCGEGDARSPARPAPAPLAASGNVTTSTRMGANIRCSPRGGEVVRAMAPGSSVQVLGEAAVALGWVHASMLEGR
jgi:hypothetical protein